VHARLYPGARDHLQALHRAGHPLAVVTNKPERFAVPLVAHLGLAPLFRCVLGGDSLPVKKPDPAPLRHALQQLGWPADAASLAQATMVGDGVQDLRAGRAAGVRTIGCLFGFGEAPKLRAERADGYWRAFGVAD
jgi:phosphoglycolate phosphatase